MSAAKRGDKVKVHYTAKLQDGTVFETTHGREPIVFTIGEGKVIRGLEETVVGMEPDSSKTVNLEPEQAYGQQVEDLVFIVDEDHFTGDIRSKIGERIPIELSDGHMKKFTVMSIDGSKVTLDANHPLAGKVITLEIQLVEGD